MSTGGHSQLKETMSIVGLPVMTKSSFIDMGRDIGEMWGKAFKQSNAEVGQRERGLAVEKGIMRGFLQLLSLRMEAGARGL